MKFILIQYTVLAAMDTQQILKSKAKNHDNNEPVKVAIAMSSSCPYSQDFIPRHLIKLMKADIPLHLDVYPMFDAEHDIDDEGQVCVHTGPPQSVAQQTCYANIAVGCVFYSKVFDAPFSVKTDFLEQHMNRFQQAPFNDDNKNPHLYAEIIKNVKGLRLELVDQCIEDEGAEIGQMLNAKFDSTGIKAQHQFGEMIDADKPNMHGLFPWVFVDDVYILIERGILSVSAFPSFVSLVCTVSPNAPACISAEEKFQVNSAWRVDEWRIVPFFCVGAFLVFFMLGVSSSRVYSSTNVDLQETILLQEVLDDVEQHA